MDGSRFDAALRALNAGTTRRRGVAAALGALLGGIAAGAEGAGAAGPDLKRRGRRPASEGPCRDGSLKANRCTKDRDCCTRICNTQRGRCRCVKRGEPCRQHRNCCNGQSCRGGVCGASTPTPPPPGCTPATCANGCCDGATCVVATSPEACGTGGAACAACSSVAPLCQAGVCAPGSWINVAVQGTLFPTDDPSDTTSPFAVALSEDDLTLWEADTYKGSVGVWTRSSTDSNEWTFNAEFGDGNLPNPYGVAVSPDSLTVWVALYGLSTVQVWTRPDAASTVWTMAAEFGGYGTTDDKFKNSWCVAVSRDTLTVWVADPGNNRISIWTRPSVASTAWSPSTTFGTQGSGDNNLNYPKGVAVSVDSLTAWVADESNHRISIWTRPDAASTTWSYSAQFGTGPGSGDAEFTYPSSVVVSPDTLTAWVVDTGNNRVVVWTRPDVSSTAWTYSTGFGSSVPLNGPTGIFVSRTSLTAWVCDPNTGNITTWLQA